MNITSLVPMAQSLACSRKRLRPQNATIDIPPDNAEPRFSAVVILDTSYSMGSNVRFQGRAPFRPIDRLNASFAEFPKHIRDDDLVARYAELAVIRCGGGVSTEQDFVVCKNCFAGILKKHLSGKSSLTHWALTSGLAWMGIQMSKQSLMHLHPSIRSIIRKLKFLLPCLYGLWEKKG